MPIDRNKFLDEMKDRYVRVFSTDDGKRVLEDIVISGGLRRSSFVNDPLILAYNTGKVDLAKNIADMAMPDPEQKQKQTEATK